MGINKYAVRGFVSISAVTVAVGLAVAALATREPTGDGGDDSSIPGGAVIAPESIHVLDDGSGLALFPGAPDIAFQLFGEGVRPEMDPLVIISSVVTLTEFEFAPDGTIESVTFEPTGGLPEFWNGTPIRVEKLELNARGEISRFDIVTSQTNLACVPILEPQPDGTMKIRCSNVDCAGRCQILIAPNPAGGFSISCAYLEDPPE